MGSFSVAVNCNRNLENPVKELKHRKYDVVYVLNVVKVEEFSYGRELCKGDVVVVLQNFIGSLLRLLLGLKCQYREYYRINVEDNSEERKHNGAGAASAEHKEEHRQ